MSSAGTRKHNSPVNRTADNRRRFGYSPRVAFGYLILFFLFASGIASATEPLHDQIDIGAQKGILIPSSCCWVDLPVNERLLEARRAARCSAIGGPVGQYKYENEKLWLVGLYRCGGPIPLNEIYPELENPTLAVWLNGSFQAKLGWLCRDKNDFFVYKKELKFEVHEGVVTSVFETTNDESACQR